MKLKYKRPPARSWLALILGVALGALAIAASASPAVVYRMRLPVLLRSYPRPPEPLYLPVLSKSVPPPPITVDLSISRVEIIQGITLGDPYTVQVAHRPAVVRVFVSLSGGGSQTGVFGKLTRYLGGAPQDSLVTGPIMALPSTDEGSLAQTLNFALPSNWLEPGTAYVVELDPDHTVAETNDGNNRYPDNGDRSFDFQDAPTLEVTIVQVRYARPGAPVTLPPTGDLSYLTWMPIKVYPLSQIHYTLRQGFYTFNGDLRTIDGWSDLLTDITNLHGVEDLPEHQVFFGLVDSVAADGCNGGCYAGIGWVNAPPGSNPDYVSKTAVGFAGFPGNREEASPTFTHEMGHNFGRLHSPCGASNGVGFYPYGGAVIGQWGFDIATSTLYAPGSNFDYMSYCGPEWTSDYTFKGVYDAWGWASRPFGTAAVAAAEESWVISGFRDATGQWQVGPARMQAVPAGATRAGGPMVLELLDASGQVLAERPFMLQPISLDRLDSGVDLAGFRVALPLNSETLGFRILDGQNVVFQRQVTGPAPNLSDEPTWTASNSESRLSLSPAGSQAGTITYDVSYSPDGGASWLVLGLGQEAPTFSVSRSLLSGASEPLVKVSASDGVRVTSRVYVVPANVVIGP